MATEVRSPPASFSRIVPRLVCSMAQPSLLTAVTAMLSVVSSLSHGTTIALTRPWPRAYSSIARDTTCGDPLAVNVTVSRTPFSPPTSPPRRRCGHVIHWPSGRTSWGAESDIGPARCQAPGRLAEADGPDGPRFDRADQEDTDRRGHRRPDPDADSRRQLPARRALAR